MGNDAESDFLRSQLKIARETQAKVSEEIEFLRKRLIWHQVDRAFEKAGGNPEIESDQLLAILQIFGEVELAGGEAGFRPKGETKLRTLAEAMDILKKSPTFAPMFAAPVARESPILENEFGKFRRV